MPTPWPWSAFTSLPAGQGERGVGFEVPLGGIPSPPPSPDAAPIDSSLGASRAALKARKRSGDAAHHIMEECERLFCETLKTVFLVEKDAGLENSLVMDLRNTRIDGGRPIAQSTPAAMPKKTNFAHGQPTPSPSPDGRLYPTPGGLVREYVEVWDYAGGARFRGFVAEQDDDMRAMFIFFDKEVIGMDLKPGLMSLLELASSDHFDCSHLIACVDRTADPEDVKDLNKSLGWVGFELTTLDAWSADACISDRYLFLGMDL